MKAIMYILLVIGPLNLQAHSSVEDLLRVKRSFGADPFCQKGIQNNLVCCDSLCGQCGGENCGAGGGASRCCVREILQSGPSCRDSEAPCKVPFEESTIVPDYSFAGYKGGGVELPKNIPVVITVQPGPGDDTQRIQSAIDQLSQQPVQESGFRGAVQLMPGTYEVGETLNISTSGIVVKGSGQGERGTILLATKKKQYTLIHVESRTGFSLNIRPNHQTQFVGGYVPAGTKTFKVKEPQFFRVGDKVLITKTPNDQWIKDLNMDFLGYGEGGEKQFWKKEDYIIHQERTIVKSQGSWLTVDIPLVDSINSNHGGGIIQHYSPFGGLHHIGIENMEVISDYSHKNDESHGWTAVSFNGVSQSWVKDFTARHFGHSAIMLSDYSNFNTFEDVAHINPISQIRGGTRYSFYINHRGGMGNLFQRCFAKESRHGLVAGARVSGPNVWLHCYLEKSHADDGPHHRWSTGLLFDSNKNTDNNLRVQNRYDSGTGHGWTGAQVMFWNNSYDSLVADAPSGAMNWIVGGGLYPKGGSKNSPQEEKQGIHLWPVFGLNPQSLYLYQLEKRLGPQAVESVTTKEQRKGKESIIEELIARSKNDQLWDDHPSDSLCSRGILSGNTCCAKSCGVCGGENCSQRPGGAESCCVKKIKQNNNTCFKHAAPCVLKNVGTP